MHAKDRQVVALERLEVARRLRIDELSEGVRPVRDGTVDRMVRGELDEPADRRAALVQLPGRMEEPRTVAEGGRTPRRVAQQAPDGGEGVVRLVGRRDERLEREVAGRPDAREVA